MSQLEQKLTDMLRPAVEALGFEMVGVEFVRAGKHSILRVFIETSSGSRQSTNVAKSPKAYGELAP